MSRLGQDFIPVHCSAIKNTVFRPSFPKTSMHTTQLGGRVEGRHWAGSSDWSPAPKEVLDAALIHGFCRGKPGAVLNAKGKIRGFEFRA